MNGQSRAKRSERISDERLRAVLKASRQLNRHRARYGERRYRTKGDAYQAGYLLGYARAYQFWHRQLHGDQRGRQ